MIYRVVESVGVFNTTIYKLQVRAEEGVWLDTHLAYFNKEKAEHRAEKLNEYYKRGILPL